jgi:Na+-transporting NADH:ubiquinone oxidoreductase subunit C
MQVSGDIGALFESIESRMVELETGNYVESPSLNDFDANAASRDPLTSTKIPDDLDIAGIRRRANTSPVYLVRQGEALEQIILPVYGSGLWSTMYGYLALAADATTVTGLRFYSHAETPGLGDQIDDPEWRELWVGKQIFGSDGEPRIEVIRGAVLHTDSANGTNAAQFQIDGLSGATLTGRGVTQLLRYWTGPHGFGPYLETFRQAEVVPQ